MSTAWWKPREDRRGILVAARMRDAEGWHDVTICNVSSRGLMIKATPPPAPGSFIELRKNDVCIVGQVKWAKGICFGIRAQDRIDIQDLLAGHASTTPRSPRNERRSADRLIERPVDLAQLAERNRMFGRIFGHAVIVSAVIAAGFLISEIAGSALKAPLTKVAGALASSRQER